METDKTFDFNDDKLFIKFLEHNKITNAFLVNSLNYGTITLKGIHRELYFVNSFNWNESPQKGIFWAKYSMKWTELLNRGIN